MLNLFQHLVGFFLLSADASFIPVHRTGFSSAISKKRPTTDMSALETIKKL